MYNLFIDRDGEEHRVYVGNIRQLRTQKVDSLGGIPVEALQRASGGRFDGRLTGFPDDPALKIDMSPKARVGTPFLRFDTSLVL